MKYIISLLLFYNLSFSQVKDIARLSVDEKKQELIETLYWIQSKTGKDFYFYNNVDKKKRYSYLEFNELNPKEILIKIYDYDTDAEFKYYSFNLTDISSAKKSATNSNSSIFLFAHSNQRLILEVEKDKKFNVHYTALSFDNLVKIERMENAWLYAIQLADEGKRGIKEKF